MSVVADVSAAAQVNRLPELLSTILERLYYDTSALISVVQVNYLWYEIGSAVLWDRFLLRMLANIPEHRRQQ
jgi:hypothetical protein